jgi:2-dehydropantoate 2-reductase
VTAGMRICVLGAGGLGSLVGGWLAESGVAVTLVARASHAAAIRARGLQIRGIRGDCTVRRPLEAVETPAEAYGEFDYLILAVKAKDSERALADAAPLLARTRVALSLQNTLVKEDVLAAHLGADRVIGASTTEAGTLVGPGVVQHVGTAPTAFYFGELDASFAQRAEGERRPSSVPSARVAALVEAFNKAGFGAREAADIRHVEWEKLLQITALCAWSVSALGVMPGGSVAEALVVREAAEHYLAIARELLAVYRSKGYEPQDFFAPYSRFRELERETDEQAVAGLQAQGQRMLDAGVIGRPSLHVDLLRGRPTEVEYCLGPFLAQAKHAGIAVPTALAGYRIIRTLEQMLV